MTTMIESPLEEGAVFPYILDLLPHLQCGDLSPTGALELAMERWGNLNKPHIIADAAFGSLEMLEKIKNWDGTATFSCSINTTPWLWQLLSHNLPVSHRRAVVQTSTGNIASLHALQNEYQISNN